MRRLTWLVAALVLVVCLPAQAASVRVVAKGSVLRAQPAADAPVLARLDQGAVLELVDVSRDWYKVREPKTRKEGFVLASLVELVPGPPSAASDAGAASRPPAPAATRAKAAPRRPLPPPAPGEWRDKGLVMVNGVFQARGEQFDYSFSPAEYSYAEEAHINSHHPLDAGPSFDAGVGLRVWRNMALGAAMSVFSKASTVNVNGTVPHPLYIDRDRPVAGTFNSPRTEVGVHLQATWVIPAGRRMLISLAGGPSYFRVRQAVASGINLSTVYPYDTSAMTGARTRTANNGGLGFHGGADVAYFFGRMVGVGGTVRYTRAAVDLDTPGGSATTHAGGVQAGVGLRLRLMPVAPRTPRGPVPAPPPPIKQ